MGTYIKRQRYLQKLIERRDNGEVKIITGTRRCGKSWLLKRIYHDYLIDQGVADDHIIVVSFDIDETTDGKELTEPTILKQYLYSRITDEETHYYVFLDEIQMVEGFERIVNGLNARDNVDVYITGSNSRFLSSDINTIFRGRGDEVRVYPLSFSEFCSDRQESISELWKEYYTYGGMPALRNHRSEEQKITYLQRLWTKTYIDDVVEGLIYAIGSDKKLVNIVNPESCTILQFAEEVRKYNGVDIQCVPEKREFDNPEQSVDEGIFSVPLGYTSVSKGIAKVFGCEER